MGAAITVALTGLPVDSLPQLAAATAALIVTLVGFGLLLGLLVRNAGALNAYGGLLVFPVLGAAGAAFAVDSGIIHTVLDLLPFSQSVRLLADGVSPRPVFDTGPSVARDPLRGRLPATPCWPGSQPAASSDVAPLEAVGLRREYGRLVALAGLDLTVEAGECVALVGANGSGKSTAVRAIAGLLEPSAGTVRVCVTTPPRARRRERPRRARARPRPPLLYDDLTVRQHSGCSGICISKRNSVKVIVCSACKNIPIASSVCCSEDCTASSNCKPVICVYKEEILKCITLW